MIDQDRKECQKCKEEHPPLSMKYYRPMQIRVCKTCYLILDRREREAREKAFREIEKL